MSTVIVRFAPSLTEADGNVSFAVDWSLSVTVTEAGDPMLYVVTPVNVAVTVPAPWATLSSVVINVSSTLPVVGIVTLVGRVPVVRGGSVSVKLQTS